jgi:hypothetical protein
MTSWCIFFVKNIQNKVCQAAFLKIWLEYFYMDGTWKKDHIVHQSLYNLWRKLRGNGMKDTETLTICICGKNNEDYHVPHFFHNT